MAAIDRPTLLDYIIQYLPDGNVLDDTTLLQLAEGVISSVGDDDSNLSEVLCKTLRVAAIINKSKISTSSGQTIKREKSHGREVEYYEASVSLDWDSFLDSLADLCPYLPGGGYSEVSRKSWGFYANVADPVNVPKCSKPYGTVDKYDEIFYKNRR